MSSVKTEDGRRATVVNEIKPNSVAEDSNAIRLLFLPNVFFLKFRITFHMLLM